MQTKQQQEKALEAAASTAPGSTDTKADASSLGAFSIELSVDSNENDAISDLADLDLAASSATASSTVYQFVERFGRTFHKYKEGKYLLPNDEQERNRLDLQHHLATRLLDDKLHLAPIGKVSRVLDIGTGTGIWAIEFAQLHPEAKVLGTDLSPIQPEFVPANVRFEIDDVEDEWVYGNHAKESSTSADTNTSISSIESGTFDYIHARYVLPSLRDTPTLLRRIYAHLRPGGYVEFMETLMIIESIDNTLGRGHGALPRWHELMLTGVNRLGRDPMVPLRVRDWLAEAGFVNIVEKKYAVPANPWARGDEQKIRGALMLHNLLEAAHGITMTVFTTVWGWSVEDVDRFLVEIREDLRNKAIHGYVPIIVIYAQKPADASE